MVAQSAAAPDADGLSDLAERLSGQSVRAVIESMTGARFVHDTLEELGWEVLADPDARDPDRRLAALAGDHAVIPARRISRSTRLRPIRSPSPKRSSAELASRRLARGPGVKARPRDAQHPAHRLDGVSVFFAAMNRNVVTGSRLPWRRRPPLFQDLALLDERAVLAP
jgi:hypothetical protein